MSRSRIARLLAGLALAVAVLAPAAPAAAADECARKARVITWGPNGWNKLVNAFAAYPAPCAEYYITIPPVDDLTTEGFDKTKPRRWAAGGIRTRGPQFHALAEFHWTSWRNDTRDSDWYAKGVRFRQMMEEAGYDVTREETWAINELPTTARWRPETRERLRRLVAGLYDGPEGAPKARGVVYVVNHGQNTKNFWHETPTQSHPYKPVLKDWTTDGDFWVDMRAHVRWWGQETYTHCSYTCVPGTTIAAKAARVETFANHHPKLAFAKDAPYQRVGDIRRFFDGSYFSVLNAFWSSAQYGRTDLLDIDQMKKLVSLQIFSVRRFANTHAYPDLRIGFAWSENPGATREARQMLAESANDLAQRVASAVQGAYTPGNAPRYACDPTGAYTWCDPTLDGAEFNDLWNMARRWK